MPYHLLHEVDLAGFNVRAVPQMAALIEQRDHSLPPLDAWWIELLETGTLRGADPEEMPVAYLLTDRQPLLAHRAAARAAVARSCRRRACPIDCPSRHCCRSRSALPVE